MHRGLFSPCRVQTNYKGYLALPPLSTRALLLLSLALINGHALRESVFHSMVIYVIYCM